MRIMSGMRPTGKLHLGHYFGVIQNWLKLQEDNECFFCVADYHALTTKQISRENVIQVVKEWLACGVKPEYIYVQSDVPEVCELHVLLSMITPNNWVQRDPTLKDTAKMITTESYGLMGYPVLMASDILLFNATHVPVGKDQVAHLELARKIARKFNKTYGETFKEPKPLLNDVPLLIGLDGNKMGKSFNNDIKISDTEEETIKKIKIGITDRTRLRKNDEGHPDLCEVIYPYCKLFGLSVEENCKKGLLSCSECKSELATKINYSFGEIRDRLDCMDENYVQDVIADGSHRAKQEAQKTIEIVKQKVFGNYLH